MQVFKFGGASIKDAPAVQNVAQLIKQFGQMPLVVVVSAMGKTTRALEDMLAHKNRPEFKQKLNDIKEYHLHIMEQLFNQNHPVFEAFNKQVTALETLDYSLEDAVLLHARVVSYGEIFSSLIIAHYVNSTGVESEWMFAPEVITTTRLYSEGEVNWLATTSAINTRVAPVWQQKIVITQGYIASCPQGIITLGKEGSDYTAAIFAAALRAQKVTIWKDVPGILNADPKRVNQATQLFDLPYSEASEMTYYGASVIHPKTIKPLANLKIPLYVRSFDAPEARPTKIFDVQSGQLAPSVIYKENQCLFSFKVLDYTFIDEEHLALIFKTLHQLNLPVNMLQNSAISISVSFTYVPEKVKALRSALADRFTMYYNTGLTLITIKNYTPYALSEYTPPKSKILLEQRTRTNYRALLKQ